MYTLPFDYLADFEPIAMVSIGPLWIIGRKDFPAKDIRELIAWLKANPGKASVGDHRRRQRRAYVHDLFRQRRPRRACSSCRIAAPRRRCRI